MVSLELHSSQVPDAVLAAVRDRAAEWRESQLPPELVRAGVTGIECKIHGGSCTIHYERRWYGPGAPGQFLRGRVTARSDASGSRVYVVVSYHPSEPTLLFLGMGFASLLGSMAFGPRALLLLILPLAIVAIGPLVAWIANRGLTRGTDFAADYLLRRVEQSLAEAGQGHQLAPAS